MARIHSLIESANYDFLFRGDPSDVDYLLT